MTEGREATLDQVAIGFLRMRENEGQYRCGVLVVDGQGTPLELRATDPLRPTPMQEIAYGHSLQGAIARLCGEPLVQALEKRPSLLLVDYEEFLPLHSAELPVVCVRRHGEQLEIEAGEEEEQADILDPPRPRWQFVRMEFCRRASEEERRHLRQTVSDLYNQLNVLEPFGRVEKALEILERQGSTRG